MQRIVVVGASLAGLRAAETLRTDGFDGVLTVIGAEEHLPYDRPPLSKKVLAGEWEPDRIQLRNPDSYDDLRLDLHLGVRATGLDTSERVVQLSDGESVPYDGVIIATGATPRRLPGQPSDLDGVFVLRTLDDALALRAAFDASPRRVVVVGAGFIGSEVAATARERGLDVTILEALPVPLARALGDHMGLAVSAVHADHGVDVRLGTGVRAIEGAGRVERVMLDDGSVLEADVVVIGIGVVPETGWLEGSGLTLRDGVVCDATCAAGPPGVFAAGDLARWPNALFDGEEMRVEHWSNAAEQGAHAAQSLLRGPDHATPFAPLPFFWSDQYDARIQFLGRARPDDHVEVVVGSTEERKFVAVYSRDRRIVGALGLSMPRVLMSFRKLLLERADLAAAREHAARSA